MDSKPDSRVENKDCYDDYFRKGLKSDFDLIQLVLLLIQKSLPIKNIDILWHHSLLPHKLSFPNRLGTKDALVQLESEPVAPLTGIDPNPRFCNLVNDFGRQEEVSCARSDLPAEAKARLTRKPQVYTCHAGLIDICVPIFAGDQYLGCIFCGQVLTRHPAKQDFKEVWKKVADLPYLKKDELQEAYFEVPVVGKDDLDVIVKILTTFADYLASSWQRLQQLLESERQRHAELSLRQQEFASLLLNGEILNLSQLEREAHDLGFVEVPTSVLVIEIGNPHSGEQVNQLLLDPDHTRAFTLLSKIAEKRPNTLVSSLRRHEFVCFTSPGCNRNPAHSRLLVRELAQEIRKKLFSSGFEKCRIGIGGPKEDLLGLQHSYEEALLSLSYRGRDQPIIEYEDFGGEFYSADRFLDVGLRHLERGRVGQFRETFSKFLGWLLLRYPSNRQLVRYNVAHFLDSTATVAAKKGIHLRSLRTAKSNWFEGLSHLKSTQQIVSFSCRLLNEVVAELRQVLKQDRLDRKIAEAITYIDGHFQKAVSLSDVATHVSLSESYFSRKFKQKTGRNFQVYLRRKRVSAATNLLVDPSLSVTDCAARVGFSDRAYFAKVFKEVVGVTPSQFANRPNLATSDLEAP